jgi:5-methyltetrahydropteroyltriglutamate--homocysteine methyltransferase
MEQVSRTLASRTPQQVSRRNPPRAEVVGSLVRPQGLRATVDAQWARAKEEHRVGSTAEQAANQPDVTTVADEFIVEAVRRQIDIGLDVVTDGEFRRYSFDTSLWDAVEGFGVDPMPLVFKNSSGEEAVWYANMIESRLRLTGNPAARDAAFLARTTDHLFKITFPAGSYEVLAFGMHGDSYAQGAYASPDEALDHVLTIERQLVSGAIEAGARYVQFDYPVYPHLVDPIWLDAYAQAGHTRDGLLERAIRMDNAVLEAVPDGVRKAMHICRGNLGDKWLAEGSLEPIAERMFSELRHDAFLLEWDDPGRQGGFGLLRYVREGVTIVLGLVSTKSPRVEAEDELLRRIDEASRYIPTEQLGISSQCGFSSSAVDNEIDEDTQWRKLEVICRVADRIWR